MKPETKAQLKAEWEHTKLEIRKAWEQEKSMTAEEHVSGLICAVVPTWLLVCMFVLVALVFPLGMNALLNSPALTSGLNWFAYDLVVVAFPVTIILGMTWAIFELYFAMQKRIAYLAPKGVHMVFEMGRSIYRLMPKQRWVKLLIFLFSLACGFLVMAMTLVPVIALINYLSLNFSSNYFLDVIVPIFILLTEPIVVIYLVTSRLNRFLGKHIRA